MENKSQLSLFTSPIEAIKFFYFLSIKNLLMSWRKNLRLLFFWSQPEKLNQDGLREIKLRKDPTVEPLPVSMSPY